MKIQRRNFLVLGSGAMLGTALSTRAAEPPTNTTDVCVYGGTASGIMAAIAAARAGASVVVIEPTKWIGGMVAGGLARTDIGKPATIGGLTREFFTRAAARYGGAFLWYAEPHANMETFEAMLGEARINVVRGRRLAAVKRDGLRLTGITTTDGTTHTAGVFIDASYEGDLMAMAGVGHIVGRESRETYQEPLAGFHPVGLRPRSDAVMGTVCPCLDGDGPHYVHGAPAKLPSRDAQGKLLLGITAADARPGSADTLTQAYNFRLTITRQVENQVPFPQPASYDPARYELLWRLIERYPQLHFGRLAHLGPIAGGKYDLNAQGFFSTDYVGGNTHYPDGDYAMRDRIWQDHADYVQGFLWFLGHDKRLPQRLRDEVNAWGLCRDEFTDNHHWPYALYVREARRMKGAYMMTQKDVQSDLVKTDAVAMGSFIIDCHIVQRIVAADGTLTDEGSFPDAPTHPYQIPYRSLTPKPSECANLLVTVCLSASHVAYGSLRMEPVYMALGQAAGIAAVLAVRGNVAVQDVPYPQLRDRLLAAQQVLTLPETTK